VRGTAEEFHVASGLSTLRLPSWRWLDVRLKPVGMIYSLNSFVAMSLALFIGFAADLERPYWSILTVYITVQPLTGALRSKAVYRVLGTFLGGIAAIVLIPNFVNMPLVLSMLMAGWTGLCLFLSLLDRTPRSYVFLLGGYTMGIIGFPIVDNPLAVFDTTVSRVEEIIIGILCATFVHTIFFPREVTVALNNRVEGFLRDARRWISGALKGLAGSHEEQERRRLASDVTELEMLATHLPFDTANLRPQTRAVAALQDSFAMLLPLISSVEDRMRALMAINALPQDLRLLAGEVGLFIERPAITDEEAEALRARCAATAPHIDFSSPQATWRSLLTISAALRMTDLVDVWRDSLALAAYVRNPASPPPRINELVRKRSRRPLHSDPGLAFLSAAALFIAVFGTCVFWIGTSWTAGSAAATFAAVFSSFFASLDDPAPAIERFLFWVIAAFPIALFYQFAVLPAIDGYAMLILVFAPFYLVLGYLQADAVQYTRAIPLILGVTGSLSLQNTYDADFTSFVNSFIGIILGVVASLWATQVFRSVGAAWSARRILKRGWRDLADLAEGRRRDDRFDWTSVMLDRVGLLTPRLALAEHPEEFFATDALADLRAGLNLIILRDAAATRELPEMKRVLHLIAEGYERRIKGSAEAFGPGLLEALDDTIAALVRVPAEQRDIQVPASLIGLRRALYPSATGFMA
jgi:uncharacterized membrane protein YccC